MTRFDVVPPAPRGGDLSPMPSRYWFIVCGPIRRSKRGYILTRRTNRIVQPAAAVAPQRAQNTRMNWKLLSTYELKTMLTHIHLHRNYPKTYT
eukprot:8431102-Pyramimonas_sp.AAC.2